MNKNEQLTTLLKEARDDLDGHLAQRIDTLLLKFEDDTPPPTPSMPTRSMDKRPRSSSEDMETDSQAPGEAHVSASVGSNEDLDFIDEDVLGEQEPGEPGYMGRNSQVQWMRTLQRKLDEPEGEPTNLPYAPPGEGQKAVDTRAHALHQRQGRSGGKLPMKECYFYLDHEEINNLDNVQPDTIPPVETAEQLSEFYQKAVHTPFRILDDTFFDQLRTYYEMAQRGNALSVGAQWKAIMNLVFAIGARFSHLIGADWQADDRDHLVYMSRAVHLLELTKLNTLASAPDNYIIQATGLLSFYYLAIGHVSKAWYMIGTSLRHAQAAGFHLRNEDTNMPLNKKRAMAQTWWALHSIECIVTSITGRPRVVYQKDCTVPLLTSLSEGNSGRKKTTTAAFRSTSKSAASGSSTTSTQVHRHQEPTDSAAVLDTFLGAWTDLDIIQHKTLCTIYSAGTAIYSWQHMQGEISALITELDDWARKAFAHDVFGSSTSIDTNQSREYLSLYLYHQSVKICVTRPCLCRLDKRIGGQSNASALFNQKTADACIQAALDLASCLPEPTTPSWLYEKGCWWSSVHIFMQAITVLLLELAQGTSHLSEDSSEITICVEKLTRWLILMKTVDRVAESAYNMVRNMLSKHSQFGRQMVPGPWLDEVMAPDPTAFQDAGAQLHLGPDSQHFPDTSYSAMSFGNDCTTTTNDGTFDMNNLADPLGNPFGGFQFGQSQYPLYYGNQFTTLFDQEMAYSLGVNTNMEDWDTTGEQQQTPLR